VMLLTSTTTQLITTTLAILALLQLKLVTYSKLNAYYIVKQKACFLKKQAF
ncbi:MAG: hypothetical protein QG651_1210, partial [Pseudomonadota bacterium]|nr:hypothetical protein [Pseudomonadota bacterium]